MGGVGIRATGVTSGSSTLFGNTVTVSPDAGAVYVRGGQGATAQRASVMGKDVYIATGNIGSVVMEGSNPRSIKNVMGGDDLYMLSVSTNPVAEAVVQSNVIGTLGGSYTYKAAAKADGIACMWLPTGSQTVSSTDYLSKVVNLTTDVALNNVATINKITKPNAPAGVSAAAGDSEAVVSFTAPGDDGGSAITGYEVYVYENGVKQDALTKNGINSPITVGGLTNEATYTFKVVACNSKGKSDESVETAAVTPKVTPPGAPNGVTAVGGDAKVTLNWRSVSGGAIGYKIYQSTTYGSYGTELATVSGSVISYDSTGLVNGTTYYFVIKAMNPGGDSPASIEVNATPNTVPGVPTNAIASAGNGQATITFTAPTDNGGSPIAGYVVTSVPGNVTATGTGTTITVNGLTNGTTYSFIIKAINAVGISLASESSNAITPYQPSSGGSSGDSIPIIKTTNIVELIVDVKEGNTDSTVSQITIQRTTSEDNKITDSVTYNSEKVSETVTKLKEENKDTARIVIPDSKDEVSETKLNIPTNSLAILSESEINLQIDTEEVKIDIPKSTLKDIDKDFKDDLYFNLVPVKDDVQKETVTKRAQFEVRAINNQAGSNTMVIGNPVIIETNMPSGEVDITLPLTGIEIPTDPKEKEAFLKQLAIYIEHTDGSKEVVQGELVSYKDGVYGLQFHINKFSIFTIIKTDAFMKSSECNVIKVTVPSKAVISGTNITASVTSKVSSVTVKVKVSEKAGWNIYRDKACTKIVANQKMKLKTGVNKAYLKVAAEDGAIKIYRLIITRDTVPVVKKEIVYNAHIKFGLIGSKSYAEKVVQIMEQNYDGVKVEINAEGNYYRIYADFTDKATAKKTCQDLIDKKYIINYYFYSK
jgi:hypothetical protein